jgi:hypothetical protein
MKIITSILFTLAMGVALTSANSVEENHTRQISQKQQAVAAQKGPALNSAIKIIAPQKDLETAIRTSEQGDILVMGSDGWYRLDIKTLRQGTKVFVLGDHNSMVSSFPKENKNGGQR